MIDMSLQIVEKRDFDTTASAVESHLQTNLFKATNLVVHDDASFSELMDLWEESKQWENLIERLRKEANAPEQSIINARNDAAKKLINSLKIIQATAKDKTSAYHKLLEDRKIEEQEKLKKIAELVDFDINIPVYIEEKPIRSNVAISYTKEVTKFRVTDLSKVPFKYLQADEKKIEQAIKLGIGEIEGIEIYKEKTTQIRCR